jgi:hypothetical protein
MADFGLVVEVHAPPARVWSVLLDVERWPEWTSSVISARRLEFGPLALGSRARIVQPRLSGATWKVTSFDEKKCAFAWTARSIGLKVVGKHKVDAFGPTSRITLSLHYSGLFGLLVARSSRDILWKHLEMQGAGLKARCEAEAARPSKPILVPKPAAMPTLRKAR